ncbi:UvrD-helicase domain-containing protein [Pseudolysinimonas sp.]|uniref:nuclease-related domain-containing DEAD/DEAH box helicase n=1 Tax=Pseudolysinimonas sp. TaxID=2680009 RepID=UPI003F8112FC
MAAGGTTIDAAREREIADDRARLSAVARQLAAGFRTAHPGRRLAQTLIELEPLGWAVLADRRWPGSLTANIDLVLVGPGGVIIADARDWRDVTVGADAVVRGTSDVTDEIARFADLVYRVQGLLAEAGVAPGEVSGLVAFPGPDAPDAHLFGLRLLGEAAAIADVAARPRRLDERRIAAIRTEIERILPPAATTGPLAVVVPDADAPRPEPADADAELRDAEIDVAALERALQGAAAAEPVESWMTSLHPDQARLARRSFSGPARVRGAAGTGKTAVALHRAAYLARTTASRVLVTSYVRALPRVLAARMQQLAPDVADRIEFVNVHALARRILVERRGEIDIDPRQADDVFRELWVRLGSDTPLVAIDPAHQYWLEELHHVIKGRGLTRFEEYESLPRTGRRRPMNREQRAAMWRLYVAYEQELRRRGILDFDDIVLEAEAGLLDEPLDRYDAIIVDEAQDLSCAALRLLHLLVGDRPDGLLLVADGRQSIYPGGWTLAEAGISVAGRGAVLTTNYRTTAEIADFAAAMLGDDTAVDLEGAADDEPATSLRHGPEPVRRTFESRALHDASFIEHVRGIVAAGGRLGDIGVLALSNVVAQEAAAALEEAGIRVVDLERYDGRPVDAVKVGTIKRAKGLEFTDVLVVRAPLHLVQPIVGDVDPGVVERRDLQRRELYVAMTRAREHVWVGVA